jgi:hypothetical protein
MVPVPLTLGIIGLAFMVVMGAATGLLISALGKRVLRVQQANYITDCIFGAAAFLVGFWIAAMAADYAIEMNGRVLGWRQGGDWFGLRWWIMGHTLTAQVLVASLLIPFVWTVRACTHRLLHA